MVTPPENTAIIHTTVAEMQAAASSMSSSLQAFREVLQASVPAGLSSPAKASPAVQTDPDWIEWDELATMLPPLHECQQIFHCFFDEVRDSVSAFGGSLLSTLRQLAWSIASVDQEGFETMWEEASTAKRAVPRHRAALVCALIAVVRLLAPKCHPAAQLKDRPQTDHRQQMENTAALLDVFYQYADEGVDVKQPQYTGNEIYVDPRVLEFEKRFRQLEAEALFCYYCASAGLRKRGFYNLGRAIRLAKSIELFDEHWWKGPKSCAGGLPGISLSLIGALSRRLSSTRVC